MRNVLIAVVVLGAGWYYYQRIQLAKKIKLVFRKISVKGDILKPKFIVGLGLQNPTGTKAVVNSIVGTISVKGKEIANVNQFQKMIIQPNTESRIDIIVEPMALRAIATLVELIAAKDKSIEFDFTGTVNAENISIPVNSKFKF